MTQIRPITTNDFDILIELFNEFARFQKMPEKMINSAKQMRKEQAYLNVFVAVQDNKVVGYVTYFFAYYTWVGKSLYMDDLYVRPNFRKKGIGSLLINGVISTAKKEGCKKLRWQVSGWNTPAIDFYKSLGAQVDAVESNCDLVF